MEDITVDVASMFTPTTSTPATSTPATSTPTTVHTTLPQTSTVLEASTSDELLESTLVKSPNSLDYSTFDNCK